MNLQHPVLRRLWLCLALGSLAVPLLVVTPASGDTIGDPVGDTFGSGPDIASITTSLVGPNQSTLQIGVNFAGPVFAPSSFNINSLGGWIVLDTNGDANPGSALSFLTANSPPAPGIDFSIDLFSEEFQAGSVNLLGASQNFVTTLPISFGASSFAVNVPVSLVGANPGVGAIVGTFRQASDAAHTSPAVTPVPEPGSLAIFATLAAVTLGAWGRTRDRKSHPRHF